MEMDRLADDIYEQSETGMLFPTAEMDKEDLQANNIPGLVKTGTGEEEKEQKENEENNEKQILTALFDQVCSLMNKKRIRIEWIEVHLFPWFITPSSCLWWIEWYSITYEGLE